MMISHKQQLVISATGGLGNRLLAIFSAVRELVLDRYHTVIVLWNKNVTCSINLDDILCFNVPIYFDDESELYARNILSKYTRPCGMSRIIHYSEFDFTNFPGLFDSLGEDDNIIMNWLYEHINKHISFKHKIPKNDNVGLHCRRSDWGKTDLSSNIIIDDEDLEYNNMILNDQFLEYIKTIISPNDRLFLSTDSINTLAYFRYKFNDEIIFNKKRNYPIDSFRSHEVMMDALTDMASLMACKIIIRDSFSTFSLASSLLGDCKLITWDRPVLKQSGNGYLKIN